MAEPLTSSDMWRIRSGWGASPTASIEERKRFAAAGELPLSSENVARLAEGMGISPMASTAEKEAWVASEVMTGQRDPMDLPKSYGGMGERPEATTRRGLRMQQEWDKQYEMMFEQQKLAKQMEAEQERLALQKSQEARMVAEQDASRKATLAKEFREEETSKQAQNAMNSVLGYTRPDGVRVRPINVNDEDAVERIQSVVAANPFGMEKQYVKETLGGMLNDAMNIRQSKTGESQQAELSALDMSIRSGKEMSAFGQYNEQGNFVPNPQAMAVESTKLKMGEEATAARKEEEKEIKREQKAEQKDVQTQVNKFDTDIRGEQLKLIEQAATLGVQVNPDGTFDSAGLPERSRNVLKGAQDKIRLIEMDKAQVQGLNFKTIEQAEKAESEGKIPSGSVIFVDGKRAVVE